MKALVLHGFTSSLDTVNLLTKSLENRGADVAMPVLRGHGTVPEHLFRVHWRDWVADARAALLSVAPTDRDQVVVAGNSVGAMVACVVAAEFPNRVKRLALMAPAFSFRSRLVHLLPVLKKVYRTWSGNPEYADPDLMYTNTNYLRFPIEAFEQVLALTKVTEDLLRHVVCPVGTFYAKNDPVVPPSVLKLLDKKLGSGPTTRHIYKRSFHELLQDTEAEKVNQDVVSFLLPS
jgi:carboxylesterase